MIAKAALYEAKLRDVTMFTLVHCAFGVIRAPYQQLNSRRSERCEHK